MTSTPPAIPPRTVGVLFGKTNTGVWRRTSFRGEGVMAFMPHALVLVGTRVRRMLLLAFAVWLAWYALALFALWAIEADVKRLLDHMAYARTWPLMTLLGLAATWAILAATFGRRRCRLFVDPVTCTVHYVQPRELLVIETPEGEWIDIQPRYSDIEALLPPLREIFGDRLLIEDRLPGIDTPISASDDPNSPTPTALPLQVQPIAAVIAELLADQTGLPESDFPPTLGLSALQASEAIDLPALRHALEEQYDITLSPADLASAVTLADLAALVHRKIIGCQEN